MPMFQVHLLAREEQQTVPSVGLIPSRPVLCAQSAKVDMPRAAGSLRA